MFKISGKNGIPSKLVSGKPTCGPFGHSSAHLVIKRGETTNCGRTSTKPSTNPPKNCSALVNDDHIIISPCSSVSISIPGHSVCNHGNGIPSRQTNTHLEDQLMVGSSCLLRAWYLISSLDMSLLSSHWHVCVCVCQWDTAPKYQIFIEMMINQPKIEVPNFQTHSHLYYTSLQGGAPQVMSWFISLLTIDMSPI